MPPVKTGKLSVSNTTPYTNDSFVVAIKTEDTDESVGTNDHNKINELHDELKSLRAMVASYTESTEKVKMLTEEVDTLRQELKNVIESGKDNDTKNVVDNDIEIDKNDELKNGIEKKEEKELRNVTVTVSEENKEQKENIESDKEYKECKELERYMDVRAVLEGNCKAHHGHDLFDRENTLPKLFKVKKTAKLDDLLLTASASLNIAVENIRVWPMIERNNGTYRPTLLPLKDHSKKLITLAEQNNPWTVFLETPTFEKTLPTFYELLDVLLFFKLYDPISETLTYCGHRIIPIDVTIASIIPILCARAGFPRGTKLLLYEEVQPGITKRIDNNKFGKHIKNVVSELTDGDIIIFQQIFCNPLPTAVEYLRLLPEQMTISFYDINSPRDDGFTLVLSEHLKIDQVTKVVCNHLRDNSAMLQFLVKRRSSKSSSKRLVQKPTFNGSLKELFKNALCTRKRKIYYQKLSAKREYYII